MRRRSEAMVVAADSGFFASVVSIIVIDLTLAGDNAIVIAMAARRLRREQRRRAILLGALAAIVVRVVLTFFVAQVLQVQLIKLIGGLVILWVGMKLFGAGAPEHGSDREAGTVWEAVKIIVVADLTMGIDNMLAVGGASGGSLTLLLFGLGFSIPFLVLTSDFLSRLMDRYPVILYVGAAVLGRVAGNMIMTDPTTTTFLHPSSLAVHAVEVVLAGAIVTIGWRLQRRARGHPRRLDDAMAPALGAEEERPAAGDGADGAGIGSPRVAHAEPGGNGREPRGSGAQAAEGPTH